MLSNFRYADTEMNMTNDPKSALDYLKLWRERHQQASDVVPLVQKSIEFLEWQCEAIDKQPAESKSINLYNPGSNYTVNLETIPSLLPMVPRFDIAAVTQVNTIAASGASGTYFNILSIYQINCFYSLLNLMVQGDPQSLCTLAPLIP